MVNFKSTNAAATYGMAIRGMPLAIKRLRAQLERKQAEVDKIFELQDPTDAEIQRGMVLATEQQLLREALETAEGASYIVDTLNSFGKRNKLS